MAFQTGSTIRPELGNADYSGFARAAEIQAAAFADLGSKIGAGIEKYQKKKKDAADKEASIAYLKQTGFFAGVDDKALEAGVNAVGAENMVKLHGDIEETKRQQELHAGKVMAGNLANIASQQDIDFNKLNRPLQLEMTNAQIAGLTETQRQAIDLFPVNKDFLLGQVAEQGQRFDQAKNMNPIVTEQALANVAATKQGTAASKAGVTMAERKQVLSEKLASQTQEQNEKDYNLKVEELRFKIRDAARRDPVSAKKLEGAQTYLDENDLVMVDGAVYKKSGFFGGTLTEVMNPAVLNLEGMEDLRKISMNMQDMRILPEGAVVQEGSGAGGQPVAPAAPTTPVEYVDLATLNMAPPKRPEGSRLSRAMSSISDAYGTTDAVINQMGESMIARPFAIYDYFTKPDSPTYDESLRRREAQVRGSGLRSQPFRDR